jgi:hypothetical protein
MALPVKAGVSVILAPGIVFNLGLGYILDLGTKVNDYIGSSNTITYGSSIFNIYGRGINENYWGGKPFLSVGGNAKFATDWEVGWAWDVLFGVNGTGWGQQSGYQSVGYHPERIAQKEVSDNWGYNKNSQLNLWRTEINYDDNIYIQYTKDSVTLKGSFGTAADMGGSPQSTASGIFGAFGRFDIIYKF